MLSLTVMDNRRRRRSPPSLEGASFAYQNTTVTNDLGADGYSWPQARPLLLDKHGNVISLAQRYNTINQRHFFVWSADGQTWTDNPSNTGHDSAPGEAFFERGCVAYDPDQDALHVLWITVNPGDGGVIYRAYDIAYSGSAITAINRRLGVSVVLDGTNTADHYQHPIMLHLDDAAYGAHGALLAVWSARKGTNGEVRASMCVLGSSGTTGGTVGNWAAPVSASTTTLASCQPDAAYSALVAQNNGAIPYPSIGRKSSGTHAGDVYLVYASAALGGAWRWRRLVWDATANDWSNAMTADTVICQVARAGTDTGYTLKNQLGTFVHEDTARDRMVVGVATWKSDADGDTFGFVLIDAADAVEQVDVYSASGVHSFAPTGDVRYDAVARRIVVSWLTSDDEFVHLRLYDGAATAGSIVTAYDAVSPAGADIPLLGPRMILGGRAVQPMLFRDRVDQSGAPLYRGLFGTLDWS